MKKALSILAVVLPLAFLGCQNSDPQDPDAPVLNQLTEAEVAEGWQLLFDGETMEHWRGYQVRTVPSEIWEIDDDAMVAVEPGHGGDLVTKAEYADFELQFEWMVPELGNSGVMFHVTEEHGSPWATGPEYQVYDNSAGGEAKNSAGSNYDVHAPIEDVSKPFGEWNQARLLVDGPHVEHWLNGVKIVEYELWTEEWEEDVANSKWVDYADYGRRETGLIAIQGDHTSVSYRNIKIRTL